MNRLLLALTTLLLASCGTDTGNPGFGPATPASGIGGSTFMVQAMCVKLNSCYPTLNYGTCYNGVFGASGMTAAMGLNATTYPTLSTASSAVLNGRISVNQTTTDQCSSAIAALSCANPAITAAYSLSTPANFDAAFNLLSASTACQNTINP